MNKIFNYKPCSKVNPPIQKITMPAVIHRKDQIQEINLSLVNQDLHLLNQKIQIVKDQPQDHLPKTPEEENKNSPLSMLEVFSQIFKKIILKKSSLCVETSIE